LTPDVGLQGFPPEDSLFGVDLRDLFPVDEKYPNKEKQRFHVLLNGSRSSGRGIDPPGKGIFLRPFVPWQKNQGSAVPKDENNYIFTERKNAA
jgi:hypothetical protein